MRIGWLMVIVVFGQYDSYYDSDGDLIPFEDLVPTQLVTTFDPTPQENADAEKESKFDFSQPKFIENS